MSCKITYEQLTAYFDGELPEKERSELKAHIDCCGECSSILRELTGLRNLLREFAGQDIQAPVDLKKNVISALRSEGAFADNTGPNKVGRWGGYLQKAIAAAATVVLVGSATWALYTGDVDKKINNIARKTEISEPATTPKVTSKPEGADTKPVDNSANNNINNTHQTGEQSTEKPADTPAVKPKTNATATSKPASNSQQQVATTGNKTPINATFLGVDRVHYTGYIQLQADPGSDIKKQVQDIATKYDATGVETASQGNMLKINVPTAYYTALFEDLKNSFAVQNSNSTRDDLSKTYRDVLIQLDQLGNEKNAIPSEGEMTQEQRERLALLEKKENSLMQQIDNIDIRARISVIQIKY